MLTVARLWARPEPYQSRIRSSVICNAGSLMIKAPFDSCIVVNIILTMVF